MVFWIVVGLLAVLALYLQQTSTKRFLPGVWYSPKHVPIFGNWFDMYPNLHRMHDWRLDQAREAEALGKEVLQRAGPFAGVVELISPRMIQWVLSTNFDNFEKGQRFRGGFEEILGNGIFNVDFEEWRTQRKIASHMFSASKLNQFMLVSFKKHSQHLVNHLAKQLKIQEATRGSGTTRGNSPDASSHPASYFIDIQRTVTNMTMDAICEIGFGVHIGALDSKEPLPFVEGFEQAQDAVVFRFLGPPWKFKLQRYLNIGSEKAIKKGVPLVNDFVYSIISTRKSNAAMYENSADLLSLFLADGAKNGKQLSDVELRDTIMSFLLAGRDTTAALISWFLYELSTRPQFEADLMEEIYRVFGKASQDDVCAGIDETSLKRAVLLESGLYEALRLHPPIAMNSRTSIKPSVFPDGTHVPGKKIVSWAPYTLGRLKSIWGDDVDEFKPDRFLSEGPDRTVVQKNQYAFPMFNAGFRLCLGKPMAILEAKTVLASLLRQYQFKVKPNFEAEHKVSVVTFIKAGLPVEVFKRES